MTQKEVDQGVNNEAVMPTLRRWVPPPIDFVKINWDAAVSVQQGCIGLGCVARSSTRCFLVARFVVKKISVDPTMAEALAALYATIFGREMGY
jgi:hypothetical protein